MKARNNVSRVPLLVAIDGTLYANATELRGMASVEQLLAQALEQPGPVVIAVALSRAESQRVLTSLGHSVEDALAQVVAARQRR